MCLGVIIKHVNRITTALTLSCTLMVCAVVPPILNPNSTLHSDRVSFTQQIAPILVMHCIRCHGPGKAEGDFSIDTREDMLSHKNAVVPGQVDASLLIDLVAGEDLLLFMPPEGELLNADEISLLKQWISEGAEWDGPLPALPRLPVRPMKPRSVVIPQQHDGIVHPIDLVLEAYYFEHNIAPSSIINDAAFLRRLSLDVLGLLPERDRLTEFMDSPNPDKRHDAAIHLLNDHRNYADHWLTFWNDLLRNNYIGTGYIDGGRTQITQWLYNSLQDNTPYDRFVAELVNPTGASAGFANGIKWRGVVNASQRRELQYAQNVSQVFLGVNMKCASCHDSFIDDWKLTDAYGMAAIIAKDDLELHRCDSPLGEFAKASFPFAEVGTINAEAPRAERLSQFAALMTHPDNGRLTRTIVNRIWARLMGRGLVEPIDVMANSAWNEDLLELLANHLREHDYDIKKTIEFIVTSRAYQRRAVTYQDTKGNVFTFRGPSPQRMTAEQFIDAVWMLTGTGPRSPDAPVAMYEPLAKWIWGFADASQSRPAGERISLRYSFTLDVMPKTAQAVVTCDNEYTLFINGERMAADDDWPSAEVVNFTSALKKGVNEITVLARNAGSSPNPAGFFFEAALEYPDGTIRRIASSSEWQWIPKPDSVDEPLKSTTRFAWTPAAELKNQQFLGGQISQRLANKIGSINDVDKFIRSSLKNSDRLMSVLGRPTRDQVVTSRPNELTTLQALELTNGEMMSSLLVRGAIRLTERFHDPSVLIEHIYSAAYSREPSTGEYQLAINLLGEQPSAEAVADFLWAIFMLPEFQMIRHDWDSRAEVQP